MYSLFLALVASLLSLFCLSLWQKAALLQELSYAKCLTEQEYFRSQDRAAYQEASNALQTKKE
jgi:hypothetical protein